MKYSYLLLLAMAILFVSSCKDDDCDDPTKSYCSNYDPCLGEVETSADFYIYENLGSAPNDEWRFFDTDTVGHQLGATFKAKYKADKYTWLIGADVLGDSVISRTNFPEDENITVTLITENFDPNMDCFPTDSGKDTLSRTFFSNATVLENLQWEGEYIGNYDHLPDEEHKFAIGLDSFFVFGLPYDDCQHRLHIINLSFNSVLFEVYDVLDQTGRCSQSMQAFMTVNQDSFWLDVIGPEANTDLNGHSMKGIKIK
ncbi:MAG: hypothetical protein ACI8YQ_002280 [Polaribacter sp.]|jgi:hypothetical protein